MMALDSQENAQNSSKRCKIWRDSSILFDYEAYLAGLVKKLNKNIQAGSRLTPSLQEEIKKLPAPLILIPPGAQGHVTHYFTEAMWNG